MGIKIKRRYKNISDGRQSIYLDFYPAVYLNGKFTRREFLKLYSYPNPRNKEEREINKLNEQIASARLLERYTQFNKPEIYSESERERLAQLEKGKANLFEFSESVKATKSKASQNNYKQAILALAEIYPQETTFNDVDKLNFNEFLAHLAKTRTPNTAKKLATIAKTIINEAVKKEYLKDFTKSLDSVKGRKVEKVFLTLEELQTLAQTQCENAQVRAAFLFACQTGLRFSDLQKLNHSNIEKIGDQHWLKFRAQKTQTILEVPISRETYFLLPAPQADGKAFAIPQKDTFARILKQWAKAAGITKNVTPHTARHTCATLLNSAGVQASVIQQMLGHSNIQTTMVYAKTETEAKIKAANAINLNLTIKPSQNKAQ